MNFKLEFKASGKIAIGTDVEIEHGKTVSQVISSKYAIEIEAHIPWKLPWFGLLGLEFEVGGKHYLTGPSAGKPSDSFEVKAFAGFGATVDFAIGEASIQLGAGLIVQREGNQWNIGGLVLLEGELDLRIKISIKVGGELIGLLKPDKKVKYEGEVAINVKLFLISLKKTLVVEGEEDLPLI